MRFLICMLTGLIQLCPKRSICGKVFTEEKIRLQRMSLRNKAKSIVQISLCLSIPIFGRLRLPCWKVGFREYGPTDLFTAMNLL